MLITVSRFFHGRDNEPKPKSYTWEDWAQQLGPHETHHVNKKAVPCFSPAVYAEGKLRANKNVTRLDFGVLDIDQVPSLEPLFPCLEGLAYIFYTTWKHGKAPGWSCRLLVPFTRPVQAYEWGAFWPAMNARFGGLCDTKCAEPARMYFAPSCPPGRLQYAVYHSQPGAALDVDALMKEAAFVAPPEVKPSPRPKTEAIDTRELKRLAISLDRKQDAFSREMARRLNKVLKGEPFAEQGERDETLFKLTGVIAAAFPKADPGYLAQAFSASTSHMGEGIDVALVEDKLRRHQEKLEAEKQDLETERAAAIGKNIREALGGGRSHPYTEEELKGFAAAHGVDTEGLSRRWVIQHDTAYYVLLKGDYTAPYRNKEAATAAALRDLAPAVSAGVETHKMTKDGYSHKEIGQLVREYGAVAERVEVSLIAQSSSYNSETRVFTEAACPLRPLTPQRDKHVEEWLKYLGGRQHEALKSWLAMVTDLSQPCAALYFGGAPGAGKTLLADGLSRLWIKGDPTPLRDAMGDFNGTITRCPLLLADEAVPKDFRGRARTEDLRQLIQGRSKQLKRKYLSESELHGAIRLIITANNRDLLLTQQNLTTDDIAAITERIIYFDVSHYAADFLKFLGSTVRSFVTEDRIARHALWLRDNAATERQGRFGVKGKDQALTRQLVTGAGLRSSICNWLVSYLLAPQKLDVTGQGLIQVIEGQLFVNSRCLVENWRCYETHERDPQAGRVQRAISGISDGRTKLKTFSGEVENFRRIELENLFFWAEENGYALREGLQKQLAKIQEAHAARSSGHGPTYR